MNIKTAKLTLITVLVHLMCFSVVLSHTQAKVAASLLNQPSSANKLASSDLTAKALGDLHTHIDKTAIKSLHVARGSVAATRSRAFNPLEADDLADSLGAKLNDFLLRIRIVSSLCFQHAF